MSRASFFPRLLSFKRFITICIIIYIGLIPSIIYVSFEKNIFFTRENKNSATQNLESMAKERDLLYGIYDPEKILTSLDSIDFEQIYVSLAPQSTLDTLSKIQAVSLTRDLLITVEPWQITDSSNVFRSMILGEYNEMIAILCSEISARNTRVIIRFAQEMDIKHSDYPWSKLITSEYITLYRYFVQQCRSVNSKAEYMWSVNGQEDALGYYPGDEFVDFVGLSVYGYPEFEEKTFGSVQRFDEMLERKYRNVANLRKSIIITEFGISGNKDYTRSYLQHAIEVMKSDPRFDNIIGFCYFYTVSKKQWFEGGGQPDFRIDISELEKLKP